MVGYSFAICKYERFWSLSITVVFAGEEEEEEEEEEDELELEADEETDENDFDYLDGVVVSFLISISSSLLRLL